MAAERSDGGGRLHKKSDTLSNKGLPQLRWIGKPGLGALFEFYAVLNGRFGMGFVGTFLRALLFGCPLLVWAWQIIRNRKRDAKETLTFWWLCLFSFLPVAISFFISRSTQSVWHPRFLIIMFVPYMLLVSMAVLKLRPRWLRTLALTLVVVWSILTGVNEVGAGKVAAQNHKLGWPHLTQQMVRAISGEKSDVKVYAQDYLSAYHLWFYTNSFNDKNVELVRIKVGKDALRPDVHSFFEGISPTITINSITDLKDDYFWFAYREDWWDESRSPKEIFKENGYKVAEGFEAGTPKRKVFLFPVWRERKL